MWSLGVMTYILLDGRAPFMGRNDRQTYRLILEGPNFFEFEKAGCFLPYHPCMVYLPTFTISLCQM